MDKVAVFLDYENVHRTGHQLFANVGEPLYETVVNPLQVAERLVAKRRSGFQGAMVADHLQPWTSRTGPGECGVERSGRLARSRRKTWARE